jgi:hypothetical protein
MNLPDHIERCKGIVYDRFDGDEDVYEDCETCLRRLAPPGPYVMEPPKIITFFCEYQIEAPANG